MRQTKARYLSKTEAAQALGVAVRTIESYMQNGLLRGVKRLTRGRRLGTFITPAEVERFRRANQARAG